MLGEYAAELEAQTVMVCDVLRRDSDNFNTFSVRWNPWDWSWP